MKKAMYTLFAIALISTTFTACKKDKADPPKPDCLITNIADVNNIIITYNNDRKIASMMVGRTTITFLYSGNTILKTTLVDGNFSSKAIVTIGANGFASNVRTESNTTGTIFNNSAFEYNGQEVTKQTRTSSANNTVTVTNFTYSGGNLVSGNSNGTITTYEYYNDQLSQKGDYFDFLNLSVGYNIFKSKNSLKSSNTGNTITSYEYTFDDLGKIITLKETSTWVNRNYVFQYRCQ